MVHIDPYKFVHFLLRYFYFMPPIHVGQFALPDECRANAHYVDQDKFGAYEEEYHHDQVPV